MTLIDALEPMPLRTRRLPCLSYEALARAAVATATRPTVDLPVAPAPAPAAESILRGNGSPVIQPGYRLGQHPANFGKKYPPSVIPPEDVRRLLAATPRTGGTGRRNRAVLPAQTVEWGDHKAPPRRANDRGHGTGEVPPMHAESNADGVKLCECGCGQPAPISTQNNAPRGLVKGQPQRFIRGHASSVRRTGYTVNADTGCWEWNSLPKDGYGRTYWQGKQWLAHRWMYTQKVGPIPEGLELDHLCKNPACVNPDHLEPVTQYENNRRSTSPAMVNARKTHCDYGHPLTGDNVRWETRADAVVPVRQCRICDERRRERDRRRS